MQISPIPIPLFLQMSFVFGGLFARREIQTAKIAKELWIIGMLKRDI